MLALLTLGLALLAQAPPAIAPPDRPIPAAAREPLPINSTVDLIPPGLAMVDLDTLHELIALAQRKDLSEENKRAGYEAFKKSGRVLEFTEPTRMIVHEVTSSKVYEDDRTGKPLLIYSGMLLDAPFSRRIVVVTAHQIADAARPDETRPPTAEELTAQEATDKANRDRIDLIYREAKTAKNAAKARSAAAHVTLRAKILTRETAHWRANLQKKHRLSSEGELDAIIARGEELDGTTDRIAAKNLAGKARAQAMNNVQLMAIGAMIDRAGSQFLADQAAANRRAAVAAANYAASHPGTPLHIPLMGGDVMPGKPWTTWAPTYQFRTSATR